MSTKSFWIKNTQKGKPSLIRQLRSVLLIIGVVSIIMIQEAQDQFDMTLKQEQQTHEQFKVDANKREKHLEQELSSLMR